MKKQATKTILSSAVSIALSAALIAGSTFALFTSESHTDISITSGNVDIQASVEKVDAYSAKWEDGKYIDDPITGDSDTSGTFANGGTYTYDSGKKSLTLDRVSPGDGVNIQIDVTNTSSISIKYQTVVTFVSGGSVDPAVSATDEAALFKALNITVAGEDGMENISSDRLTAVSKWSDPVATKDDPIGPINVNIELPMETGDALQAMQCEMLISVYAVQSNGHDETNQERFHTYLTNSDNIADVFEELQDGDVVVLNDNVEYEDSLSVEGVEATLDLGGKDLTLDYDETTETGGELVVDMGGSLTLTGEGTVSIGENYRDQAIDHFIVAYNDAGSTTTLNIDCEVNLDNVYEARGYVYDGIWAEGKSEEEGGAPGSKAVINITDNAYIHRSVAAGAPIGVGANAEVNMKGGKIEVTPSENSSGNEWVPSAVCLDGPGAVFNLSGGEIIVQGNAVIAVNLLEEGSKFFMTGGRIEVNIHTTVPSTQKMWCSAAEVYYGDVEMTGGEIEIKSDVPDDAAAMVCAFYASTSRSVVFGKDAKIIVHKAGDGGSNRNFSIVTYNDEIVYDESGDSIVLAEGMEGKITNWTLEGTVELRRA